jgi:DNA polymerase-3 subunit gamma/tau
LAGELYRYGYDTRRLCRDLVEHLRNLVVAKIFQDPRLLSDLPDHEIEEVVRQADKRSLEDLQRLFKLVLEGEGEVSRSAYPQLVLEMTLVKLATLLPLVPIQEILAQIAALEARLSSGPCTGDRPVAPTLRTGPIDGGESKPVLKGRSIERPYEGAVLPAAKDGRERPPLPTSSPSMESRKGEKSWEEFLAFVRGEKLTLFFSLSHSRLLTLTPTTLQIGLEKEPYLRELERKDNRALLQDLACRFFQRELEVVIRSDPAEQDLPRASAASKPTEGLRAAATDDPLVKTALEVLGGEVQTVRSPRSSG